MRVKYPKPRIDIPLVVRRAIKNIDAGKVIRYSLTTEETWNMYGGVNPNFGGVLDDNPNIWKELKEIDDRANRKAISGNNR